MHHWFVVSVVLFCICWAFLLHDASFICSCCCFILQNSWAFLLHDTSLICSWICSFSSANLELLCFMMHALTSSPCKFCFANLKIFFFFSSLLLSSEVIGIYMQTEDLQHEIGYCLQWALLAAGLNFQTQASWHVLALDHYLCCGCGWKKKKKKHLHYYYYSCAGE